MHQNSKTPKLTETAIRFLKPLRGPRKVPDGDGLYVLVAPTGRRYWRYNYRYDVKQKTLALGLYPDVSLDKARARHVEARRLLAAGVDPSSRRLELRRRQSR